MGPAVEIFLLVLVAMAAVAGVVALLTRPLWKRAWNKIVDTDRCEREALEEQARARAEEAECRRRAEEELKRCLAGEEPVRNMARNAERDRMKTQQTQTEESKVPCEETNKPEAQVGEHH